MCFGPKVKLLTGFRYRGENREWLFGVCSAHLHSSFTHFRVLEFLKKGTILDAPLLGSMQRNFKMLSKTAVMFKRYYKSYLNVKKTFSSTQYSFERFFRELISATLAAWRLKVALSGSEGHPDWFVPAWAGSRVFEEMSCSWRYSQSVPCTCFPLGSGSCPLPCFVLPCFFLSLTSCLLLFTVTQLSLFTFHRLCHGVLRIKTSGLAFCTSLL